MSVNQRNRVRSQHEGESYRSKGNVDFNIFGTPIRTTSYNDLDYNTWYRTKHEFCNQSIKMHDMWRSDCGHVISTNAYDYVLDGVTIIDYDLQWRKLYDKRYNLKMYWRWH